MHLIIEPSEEESGLGQRLNTPEVVRDSAGCQPEDITAITGSVFHLTNKAKQLFCNLLDNKQPPTQT